MIFSIVAAIIIILLLDGIWLGLISKKDWNSQILSIQGKPMKIRVGGAIVAYVLLVVAVIVFGVLKVRKSSKPYRDSLIYGSLLGLCIYGVYDGTVYAILEDYTLWTAAKDVLWGVFLLSVTTLVATYVDRRKLKI